MVLFAEEPLKEEQHHFFSLNSTVCLKPKKNIAELTFTPTTLIQKKKNKTFFYLLVHFWCLVAQRVLQELVLLIQIMPGKI